MLFLLLCIHFVLAQGDYSLSKQIPLNISASLSPDKKTFSSTFGDYNNDGFVDLFVTGYGNSILFQNKNGEFVKDTVSSIIGLTTTPSAKFLDYDNDRDLDLFVIGNHNGTMVARLYENDSSNYSFRELTGSNFAFQGLSIPSSAVLDYNNDGFMDIFITGTTDSRDPRIFYSFIAARSILYKNNNGTSFTVADTTFENTLGSNIMVVDYNNDGNSDIIIQGIASTQDIGNDDVTLAGKSFFYKNNGTGFLLDTANSNNIIGITSGSSSFGDYDNDGDVDIFTSGCIEETTNSCNRAISKLYRNDSSRFSEVPNLFNTKRIHAYDNGDQKLITDSVYLTQSFFRDYNNDGFLDIFSFGTVAPTPNKSYFYSSQMKLYKNNSGTGFSEVTSSYLGSSVNDEKKLLFLYGVDASFGDYDNNGTLDIILSGSEYNTKLYVYSQDTGSASSRVNTTAVVSRNTIPTPPTNPQVSFVNSKAFFSWSASIDQETETMGLSYNMYVGTRTNRDSIKASLSFTENNNGTRKISEPGIIQGTSYNIDLPNLPNGRYYWGVQAIDGVLAGGSYSQAGAFIVNNGRFKGLKPQTITFTIPAQKIITDTYFIISATANTTMPIRFVSSNPSIATINVNTVTIKSAGIVHISAFVNAPNGSADTTYIETTEVIRKLEVIKVTQTISFPALSPQYAPIGNTFVLNASASSRLELSYVPSNTMVSINRNTATIRGIGTVNITAIQSGNNNYEEAIPITRSLTISKLNQTITFGNVSNPTIGQTLVLNASSSSSLMVSYRSSDVTIASVNGNTLTAKAVGSVTITATQEGNENFNPATATQNVTVINSTKLIPSLTFTAIPNLSIGQKYTLIVTSNSPVPIIFTSSDTNKVSIRGTTATAKAIGTATITANQVENTEYNAATAQQTVTVVVSTTPSMHPLTPIEKGNSAIRIYPNPANDYITIQYDKTQKVASVKIYDITGKSYELRIRNYELGLRVDLKTLSKGEYIIILYGEKGEVLKAEKIIKE
ncbi:MAG: FG-GAP-like repeat-containing protein [Chitinophagaceae bacterium]|nr:FG-GAP-like repeat-containing protein [Chitinophagaceae bacterium]